MSSSASAQTHRAVVVEGASGDEEHAARFRGWIDEFVKTCTGKLGLSAAQVIVLSETPAAGETKSSAEAVKALFSRLIAEAKPDDVTVVLLIGHGSFDGVNAKFNLPGPDLTDKEWGALLKPLPGYLVFVDTSSASAPFLGALAGDKHVVITSTNSPAQVYDPFFAEGFIKAFSSPEADLDKNGRTSMWEAFAYASRVLKQRYSQKGDLQPEHAVLDDDGDGTGRMAEADGKDGLIAGTIYLDAAATPTSTDPQMQMLLQRQQVLTGQVDDLKRQKAKLKADDYQTQWEQLMIDLALVSRELRRKGFTGGV